MTMRTPRPGRGRWAARITEAWRRLLPPRVELERPFVPPGGWCSGTATCRFTRSEKAALPASERTAAARGDA